MRAADFDYVLPPELIAQVPLVDRSASRLLLLDRSTGTLAHHRFADLPELLRPGDAVVVNDSRVLRARLRGRKSTGGAAELLLIRPLDAQRWTALARPGLRIGTELRFGGGLAAQIERIEEDGLRVVRLTASGSDLDTAIDANGELPTPPYIHEPLTDPERYQTVYAREAGSIAAPTAGLHFTPELLDRLRARDIAVDHVTLHVGIGTFRPVVAEHIADHVMHAEWARLDGHTAEHLNRLRAAGGRIVAIGTTTVRTLETAVDDHGVLHPYVGDTSLFIVPGFRFRAVDALLTNFHLPKSTLLLLVSAFAGIERTRTLYREALQAQYRFYSFGDCCLLS